MEGRDDTHLSGYKTKIVCTIGPACEDPDTLERMIRAGMSVARLNFSHGERAGHASVIERIRRAAGRAGQRVAILADLPGPKIRIGQLAEPVELKPGDRFTLTVEPRAGDRTGASISYAGLPRAVKRGDTLFVNDGLIQLEVVETRRAEVVCRVVVGGPLGSRKGLNVPGVDLGAGAFTEHDRGWLEFAMSQGVDAVSQSFVAGAADVDAVRAAASAMGRRPFVIAKIERSIALDNLDAILAAADGIMVARGDLGVEIPIERIAVVQKHLIHKANVVGKPVITATQMLESMVSERRPTRAEATDVANAILDGTDCVMLSAESAVGAHPVEAVEMLGSIAAATEPHRSWVALREVFGTYGRDMELSHVDLVALSIARTFERASPAAVFVPTRSGATARNVARFRLPVWIVAVSPEDSTCQELQFSYGVAPVHSPDLPPSWTAFARDWLRAHGVAGDMALLTEGPSPVRPDTSHRMEILDLARR